MARRENRQPQAVHAAARPGRGRNAGKASSPCRTDAAADHFPQPRPVQDQKTTVQEPETVPAQTRGQDHAAHAQQHAVHGVDVESEHGELKHAVRVRQPDRAGESRTNLVLRNHHDMPSVLLHTPDDRQTNTPCPAPVTAVMTQDAATPEQIISHARRLRGEHSSRTARARDHPPDRTTPPPSTAPPICARDDLYERPRNRVTRRTQHGAAAHRAIDSITPLHGKRPTRGGNP